MTTFLRKLKKTISVSLLLLVAPALPLMGVGGVAFADDSTPPPCVAPAPTTPGVHTPNGADAGTFVYQCNGPNAGLWTNDHYAYDPATGNRIALDPTVFTYNAQTGMWDYTSWDYSATKNIYVAHTLSVTTPPAGASTVGSPPAPAASNSDGSTGSSGEASTFAAAQAASPTGSNTLNTTGTFNTTLNNNTGAVMSNIIISGAGSGNASVIGNTTGGSATSGNAQAISNIINMLQSSSSLNDPNLITFTANINGDVNGDLLLDPAQLGAVQPANSSATLDNNLTINNSTDATITNNVNLDANSGDATISGNTIAGNATTGNAAAVANIVNILNSAVTAGQSFVGVININGNLNGDILLPPDFVNTLLASNVPHYTISTSTINNNVTVNNANNATINNDINASADSGNASVDHNTSAGNATTGNASTNLTVFNLTGSNVVASNDLLVFVNVLGTWYGMIMNAPGSTAAELGGNVTANSTIDNNASLTNTNDSTINNNINVHSTSGDATVADNTSAGNARTGDASSSVNLLNMINDSLSLNGWFGLLFINVFGTWNGSFGVNTSAGNPVITQSTGSGSSPMFGFTPAGTVPGGSNKDYTPSFASVSGSATGSSSDGTVLAANTAKGTLKTPGLSGISPSDRTTNHLLLPILGASFAFLILFAGERSNRFRRTD